MASVRCTITDDVGLHARPAAQFVKLATGFSAQITVAHGSREANAKSLVEVLQLEAGKGAEVVVTAEGEDAEDAVRALAAQLGC